MKIDRPTVLPTLGLLALGLFAMTGCREPSVPQAAPSFIAPATRPTAELTAAAIQSAALASPDGAVHFQLENVDGRLTFAVRLKDVQVLDASPMSFTVDDVDLATDATIVAVQRYTIHETFPMMGGHRVGVNNAAGQRLELRHKNGTRFTLDVRAFDDAVAFRFVVPDVGRPRTPDEATTFVIPAGSDVWFHGIAGHYEGDPVRHSVEKVTAGEWVAPPMTIRLPKKAGYAAITEANLVNYPGMALEANGQRGFVTGLGHRQPPSRPFLLRYRADAARRLAVPAAIDGEIVTPWRVTMIGATLDALVNCDAIQALCPPPDPKIFPDGLATDWIRPGRAVWRYLDGGPDPSVESMKTFCDGAAALGFEYNVMEGFWRRWSADDLKAVCDYGKSKGVAIWVWAHSKDLHTADARKALYDRCTAAGVAGLKIDFFDHEAKELIDLYSALQRETAERHLLVDFHGANKPTGEIRTWPNELTREAVHGMESRGVKSRALHDTTLPFTRWLAGPADYTPVLFSDRRGDTTWAHQVATTVTLTSPLLTYAATPQHLLENPCVEMIKSVPSVWDETIVLPASEVGECAAFARRSGSTWFVAVANGPAARSVKFSLSFMDEGDYHALVVTDTPDNPAAVVVKQADCRSRDAVQLELEPGGGFIARYEKFKPSEAPLPPPNTSGSRPAANPD